jgi:hypothetical protein
MALGIVPLLACLQMLACTNFQEEALSAVATPPHPALGAMSFPDAFLEGAECHLPAPGQFFFPTFEYRGSIRPGAVYFLYAFFLEQWGVGGIRRYAHVEAEPATVATGAASE